MSLSCTYDPTDNKLRLRSSIRLDKEIYDRVKSAGFKWAPKQELFVAPMWTPEREDLLLELCGEIDDEDTSLVDRAEERAERFEDYGDRRKADAERAHSAVAAIADNIPFGQPILVGHHSEKRARKDAERIENGMRKAINMWDTAKYWQERAKGALRHAKYKERPDVRARRIKTIEADQRKQQRTKAEAERWLKLWSVEGLTLDDARKIANVCHLSLPRKEGDREDFPHAPDVYDALNNGHPNLYAPRTLEEVIEAAKTIYPRIIARCERWIQHYDNRLVYEMAMLAEQGATELIAPKPRPTQLPLCNYRQEIFQIENKYRRGEIESYPQIEMTTEEYAKIHKDYKGTYVIEHSHRVRMCIKQSKRYVVFLTDSKVHTKPAPKEKAAPLPKEAPVVRYQAPEPTKFDALKDALKAGVQVVSAPQLFPTPPELAKRMIEIANLQPGHRILEPSAGTGSLLKALDAARGYVPDHEPPMDIVAVEISPQLVRALPERLCGSIRCADFLSCNGDLGTFDRIVMNPPFQNGSDIAHILHARSMLKPGGKLVAICANGPRQQERLRPLAETWEPLPAGTFEEQGTSVNTVLLTMSIE